jgi:hypothetical protein
VKWRLGERYFDFGKDHWFGGVGDTSFWKRAATHWVDSSLCGVAGMSLSHPTLGCLFSVLRYFRDRLSLTRIGAICLSKQRRVSLWISLPIPICVSRSFEYSIGRTPKCPTIGHSSSKVTRRFSLYRPRTIPPVGCPLNDYPTKPPNFPHPFLHPTYPPFSPQFP